MAAALSQEEAACLEALEVFVQGRYHRSMLIRFVLARKADIPRCKTLITKFDEIEETLHPAAIRARHVRSILERGVLQLPGTRDKLGGKLIVYHANRHIKTRSDVERVAAIKAAIYVVEAALAAVEDLRHGVSIVANLGGLGYGKLDHVMHKIVLDTLQDAYPARVVRVYVVYPGFVTDMLLKMMRPFMKAKLKEKIVLVPTFDKLQQHIVQDQLPQVFGGSLAFDHHRWLNERLVRLLLPCCCLVLTVGCRQKRRSPSLNILLARSLKRGNNICSRLRWRHST